MARNDIEVKNQVTITTYNLFQKLKEVYSKNSYQFYLVIGSDLVNTLDSWNNATLLKSQIDFIIFKRSGFTFDEKNLPAHYQFLGDTEKIDISSTKLRELISSGWEQFISKSIELGHPACLD